MSAGGLFSLEARVALVTGAGSGLGAAMARGLAGVGARVVCLDRDGDAAETVTRLMPRGHGLAVRADVTDPGDVHAALDAALAAFDGIDVLVNSAGIGGRGVARDYPDELWRDVLAVNLSGSFNMCRLVGGHMIERGGGSIVNVASIGGLVGFPGSVGYQASKGGVVQMTRALAMEWAEHGVRVNAIAPGHIATAIVRRQWELEPQLRDFFLARTPLERLGEPSDVVGPAIFFASDASAMVTGQVLPVDGGYTAQ